MICHYNLLKIIQFPVKKILTGKRCKLIKGKKYKFVYVTSSFRNNNMNSTSQYNLKFCNGHE